jgi:hypothetical protein
MYLGSFAEDSTVFRVESLLVKELRGSAYGTVDGTVDDSLKDLKMQSSLFR